MDPSNDPRQAWQRFAKALQEQQARGGPNAPKGAFGIGFGVVALGLGYALVSNALFNGTTVLPA